MSHRVLIHASVVACLVLSTAVPGRSQRQVGPVVGAPLEYFEVIRLYASDAQGGLQFGSSVDVDGDVAVVGALQKAYVFRDVGGQWVEEQILQPTNTSTRPLAVAVDDDVIAVGASLPVPGTVTIYRYDGAQWSEETTLRYCCSNQSFGWSVDLDDGVLAVGDPDTWIMGAGFIGSVYIFRDQSGNWEPEGFLLGTIDGAKFGHTVSVAGDRLLVGVPFVQDFYIPPTYAELYWFDATQWRFLQRIEEPNGVKGTHMGMAVALDRDTALISDPAADPGSTVDAGITYLLRSDPADPRKLKYARTSTSSRKNARYGQEVALFADTALIGERGTVSIRRIQDNDWRLLTEVPTGQQVPSSGRYLATNGSSHWIGQPLDDARATDAGAVMVVRARRLGLTSGTATVTAGGPLSLQARGGAPSTTLRLAWTELDGTRMFLLLDGDFVDVDGTPTMELWIPRELAGHSLGLTLCNLSEVARWATSDELRIEVTSGDPAREPHPRRSPDARPSTAR